MLGGSETPAVLFTAGHGLGWPSGHPDQLRRQGALACQEWAGPHARVAMSDEQYVAAHDITDDAAVHGLIAFHFACFGAGTPEFDGFAHRTRSASRGRLAAAPMISALPRRLLGHPGGLPQMRPRLASRAQRSAMDGFATATIELPGGGDRPMFPAVEAARADLLRVLDATAAEL